MTFVVVLLMPLAETIKAFVSLLKDADLLDHTSIFLLRTINYYVTLYKVNTLRSTPFSMKGFFLRKIVLTLYICI